MVKKEKKKVKIRVKMMMKMMILLDKVFLKLINHYKKLKDLPDKSLNKKMTLMI